MKTLQELAAFAARHGLEVHETIGTAVRTGQVSWAELQDQVRQAWVEKRLGGVVVNSEGTQPEYFGVGPFRCRPDDIDRIELLAGHAIAFYKLVGPEISPASPPIEQQVPTAGSWMPSWAISFWYWLRGL